MGHFADYVSVSDRLQTIGGHDFTQDRQFIVEKDPILALRHHVRTNEKKHCYEQKTFHEDVFQFSISIILVWSRWYQSAPNLRIKGSFKNFHNGMPSFSPLRMAGTQTLHSW